MLIAGIVEYDDKCRTANLINSILSSTGKKISIVDTKNLIGLDSKRLRSYVFELDKNNVDILILKINITDAEKEIFNHLHFDIMIYSDKADDLRGINYEDYLLLMRKVFSLLDEKGVAIVNEDDVELIKLLRNMKFRTITYGFNSKASITTSSIGDRVFKENFMFCLQRSISARNGLLIEPQEYMIKVDSNEHDAYNVLAAATFAIVNGVDLNSLSI